MFNKVSVLVPTRGRKAWLEELFASFLATGGYDSAELIFRIDNDDVETRNYLFDKSCTIVVGPRMAGYTSLPVFFNEMISVARGDVFMCGNDDMIFKTDGWPEKILAAANKFPDGLFDIGVATHNEGHYPFSVVSRKIVEQLGFLWDPRIFWGDIYLRDVMNHFGRLVNLPNVEIEHRWAGNRPDQVFRESNKTVPADYWSTTHRIAVADAVNKLSGLTV